MFFSLASSGLLIRASLSIFCSFFITFFLIKKFLIYSKKKELFQPIRANGPDSHLATKIKTPTMGGIFIFLGSTLTNLLFNNLSNPYILICLFITMVFAAIGLIDDLLKVIYKNPKGFRGSCKLLIQFTTISFCYFWLRQINEIHNLNGVFLPIKHGYFFELGLILYLIFINCVIVGSANSFNLTDGLDGLASFPAIITLLCLALICFIVNDPIISSRFNVQSINGSIDLFYFCLTQAASVAGFLCYNRKPAKIFMGDVGSLGIGASFGIVAVIIKQEFVFCIISLLFVIEAFSVILQVLSYKIRKKRIFLMAPIHHHFEKLGFSEVSIVKGFWLVSLIFALLGLVTFFLYFN